MCCCIPGNTRFYKKSCYNDMMQLGCGHDTLIPKLRSMIRQHFRFSKKKKKCDSGDCTTGNTIEATTLLKGRKPRLPANRVLDQCNNNIAGFCVNSRFVLHQAHCISNFIIFLFFTTLHPPINGGAFALSTPIFSLFFLKLFSPKTGLKTRFTPNSYTWLQRSMVCIFPSNLSAPPPPPPPHLQNKSRKNNTKKKKLHKMYRFPQKHSLGSASQHFPLFFFLFEMDVGLQCLGHLHLHLHPSCTKVHCEVQRCVHERHVHLTSFLSSSFFVLFSLLFVHLVHPIIPSIQ